AICAAPGGQFSPVIASDGSGGAVVAWVDRRTGVSGETSDVYAQRVNSAGMPQWAMDGVAICTAANNQGNNLGALSIAPDGSGGGVIVWEDERVGPPGYADIYARRINGSGVPQWATDGVLVCDAANTQINPLVINDSSG